MPFWIPLSLNNFLMNVLQPSSSKLLGISENYVILTKSPKIFQNSLLKNDILEFSSEALIVSILINSSNDNHVRYQNLTFTKIVITNFREKLRKFSFMFFSKISKVNDLAKSLKSSQLWIILDTYILLLRLNSLKFQTPTVWGLKNEVKLSDLPKP